MSKPRLATIEKYTEFLKELSERNTVTTEELYQIIKKRHLNNSIVTPLVSLNYIEKRSNKTFKILILKASPKHALDLLTLLNSSRSKAPKQKEVLKKPAKTKSLTKPVSKEFKLLWGLIYIKW